MEKVKLEKDGVIIEKKPRFSQSFIDKGWTLVSKKVSKPGKAKVEATADVIEEDFSPQLEDITSMPNHQNEGEE